jgi:hypothetical protein
MKRSIDVEAMYIPFTRKGFLVPVVGFGALLATEYAVESYFHDSQYYQHHGWPKTLGLWLGGVLIAGISQRIGETEARTLIEPETGRAVVLEPQRHTFLYVPMKYWPGILFVLGLVFLFTNAWGA